MRREQLRTLAAEIRQTDYAEAMAAKDYAAVAAALNARKVIENPEEQEQVPRRFTWDTFMAELEPADIPVMYQYGDLARDLRTALEGDDVAIRNALWRGLRTVLTPSSVTAVIAAFQETVLDPDWTATVELESVAQSLGLPVVTESDVLRAAQIEA
jgi:hypothetical protein